MADMTTYPDDMTAQQLWSIAFVATSRDPRSQAYKEGALYALQIRAGERDKGTAPTPYALGSPQADAYLAGADEGHRVWRDYQERAGLFRCYWTEECQ